MKKYLTILILGLLFLSQITAIAGFNTKTNTSIIVEPNLAVSTDSRAVFVEECTATWCPNCPFAADALYNLYNDESYNIYYVALVHDTNPNAKERLDMFTAGIYRGYAFPTAYFDGGVLNVVGRGNTVEETETLYKDVIAEAQNRPIYEGIELQSTVEWVGDSTISVNVDVVNYGNSFYFGKIRSYIVEIESRWDDFDGNPYHFGFLDFAIDDVLFLPPGSSKTISVEWDGKADHDGISFDDLSADNIAVISTVSHWKPIYKTGYESNTFTQRYFAFQVDETQYAIPE